MTRRLLGCHLGGVKEGREGKRWDRRKVGPGKGPLLCISYPFEVGLRALGTTHDLYHRAWVTSTGSALPSSDGHCFDCELPMGYKV